MFLSFFIFFERISSSNNYSRQVWKISALVLALVEFFAYEAGKFTEVRIHTSS